MSQAGIINMSGGGGGGSPIETLTGNTGGAVSPTANNINVVGAGAIVVTGNPGTSTLTITVTNDGFPWFEEATSFNAAIQTGYFCTAALTASLPVTAGLVLGNTIIFVVDTASTVVIQAAAGQQIQNGASLSSSGGTATSTAQGSVLELVFRPNDGNWHTISSMGSWDLM